jgi:hypothetical protein
MTKDDLQEELTDPLNRLFQYFDKNWASVATEPKDFNQWIHRRDQLLNSTGFCVVPAVLTIKECSDAVDRIWEFVYDTTYGKVRHDDPASWCTLWPNSTSDSSICTSAKFHHEGNDCLFQSNGAGYLLSNIHEILADRVFSLLFGTRELHCSKEGFQFRPLKLNHSKTNGEQLLEESKQQFNNSCSHSMQSCMNKPHIRSMVALEDLCEEHSFICYPGSFMKDYGSSSVSLFLQKGDVLIWRSDLVYCIPNPLLPSSLVNNSHTYQQFVATMFCAMQPAIFTPNASLPIKMEAYKQRQTGTYRLDTEQWLKQSSQSIMSQNPYDEIRTQQFYRTGPPLLTNRQAQIYGLVPYHNHTICPGQELDNQQRALIRGVRFLETNTLSSRPAPISLRSNSMLDTAHLVHLSTKDPLDMIGQDKYLGGMASPCGKYVYGVPGGAKRVLRITISNGQMDLIGPAYEGKFKWLRGVDVTASAMKHDPKYPDGCCIALPCNSSSVLKIDPATNDVYTFGGDVLRDCGSDRWHYHGGNVASNGWLYAIPANATRVAKIHPVTDEVIFIGPTFVGGQKWFGGITGSDGCIYGIPHNEQSTTFAMRFLFQI